MAKFLQQGGKDCDGQTTVVIHFLDNSSKTVLTNETTTAGEVLQEMYGRLMISDPKIRVEHFALYTSNGDIVGDRITTNEKILDMQMSCAKIIMQIRLLVHSIPVSRCSMVRHLLYIQTLHNIITEYYYVSAEDAGRLAALCLLERYGVPKDDDAEKSKERDMISKHLVELIPSRLLKTKSTGEWTQQIFSIYNNFKKDENDPHAMDDAKGLYLSMVENLGSTRDEFLCTIFKCRQNFDKSIDRNCLVAINADDIRILDGRTYEKKEDYDLNEIYQWGFDEDTLNFYIRMSDESQQLIFETQQGVAMSTLLTDIAIARLKDNENSEDEESDEEMEEKDYSSSADDDDDNDHEDDDLKKIVKLQAQWRSSLHRHVMNKEYAVVMLQSAFRGYKARVQFDKYIEMVENGEEDKVKEEL